MKISEARKVVEAKRHAGIISNQEAARFHREISRLSRGYSIVGRISRQQQSRLLAVWSSI